MIRQFAAIFLCLGQLYISVLWVYTAIRTSFLLSWLFALVSVLYLLLGFANLAFTFAWSQLHQMLGSQFSSVFDALLLAQPVALLLGAVAHTLVVTWLLRSRASREVRPKT
jgi:hypothetical protein